jgi:hypothetical protein
VPTILDNPGFITRELINDHARKDERDRLLPNKLLQYVQKRLLLMVLGEIKPDAGINQNLKHMLVISFSSYSALS